MPLALITAIYRIPLFANEPLTPKTTLGERAFLFAGQKQNLIAPQMRTFLRRIEVKRTRIQGCENRKQVAFAAQAGAKKKLFDERSEEFFFGTERNVVFSSRLDSARVSLVTFLGQCQESNKGAAHRASRATLACGMAYYHENNFRNIVP